MSETLLVLNSGSSSIKFALYPVSDGDAAALVRGTISDIGGSPDFTAQDADGRGLPKGELEAIDAAADHGGLTARLLDWLETGNRSNTLAAAGHRVVHGGLAFTGPAVFDADVMARLRALVPLAPLHQPHNLAAVRAIAERRPGLHQVACFDTAFHRTQPRVAQLFALPRRLSDDGVVRYGFHGLSYDYIARVLPGILDARAEGRIVVAHLGNGSSMCAMHGRKSVATTMGFTALHGLMMGRRSGTLDAGVVVHLYKTLGMTMDEIEHLLYRESGLLGVSGLSNDMQDLEQSSDPHAHEAIDLYCYRAAAELAALVPAMGGLDAIVFTAGIGENSVRVRREICTRLSWMGVELDDAANGSGATHIAARSSKIDVLVVPTDEELVIAEATRATL